MVAVASNGSLNCRIHYGHSGNGVRAPQNGLAFTDYNLRATPPAYKYAKYLIGGGTALAANNWGIDGVFGNDARAVSYFGEGYIRNNGVKWLVYRPGLEFAVALGVYAYN
ncbi:MAG: hypothetical protein LBG60_12615 [Bifidobacteriaceae bacterium]|jgi:hypothetical protein|nr:hypothetical protein [Bifidobacteriaceae bacterium]